MRTRFALVAAVVLGSVGVTGSTQAVTPAPPDPVSAFELGRQAYEYGIPLLEFERVRREETSVQCPDHVGNAPVNTFSHTDRFADASFRDVVAVNTDTLYSIAQLDLSKGPLVLSHPAMGSRYFSFAMLDPFTNVVATPGVREDGPKAGRILVRSTVKPGNVKTSRFTRVITTPYQHLWVIGRTLATTKADQRRAYRTMRRYAVSRPNGTVLRAPARCRTAPTETPRNYPVPTSGAPFLDLLGKALAKNPPPLRDRPILQRLRAYGVGPGLSPDRAGLDPVTKAALYAGASAAAQTLRPTGKGELVAGAATQEGWYEPQDNIGRYGTDYHFRALIAVFGLGANTREEATYPIGLTDGRGVPYVGGNDYRLTFPAGQAPPVRYFWSLTMYDADGYLVPNPGKRYSVGPSHPPFVTRPDGSVVIAVQHDRPADPMVNWLPAPASGQFRLNLRLYGPRARVLDGSWSAPGVENLGPRGGA